ISVSKEASNSKAFSSYFSTLAHDDLVQSMAKPEWVVAAGSYPAYSEPNIGIVVFETDPQSGAVSWTRHLGAIGSDLRAKAIIRNEKQQIYYLMGEYDYVENDQGFREMYLCALDKAGTPRWERHYRDPINEANFQSSDLIYHPEKNIITITSKLSKAGKMLGASVTHINPNDGDIINTFRISEIDGNPDIRINDAIDARERTVLVGELNEEPTRSFLLVFEPGKVPTSVLSKIYAADNKFNLRISGVRQHAEGLLYASFDYQRSSSQPNPGLLELKNTGDLTASYIYQVPDYEESIGLLTTYDQKGLVIKGTTGFAKDNALLSLVGVNSPLKDDEKICSKRIDVLVSSGAKVEKYELKALELDASFETEMVVNKGKAEVRPCRQ
ncbi:MAG: hypothetical protein AAFN93_18970, partial [Bacteroidota bacterium]